MAWWDDLLDIGGDVLQTIPVGLKGVVGDVAKEVLGDYTFGLGGQRPDVWKPGTQFKIGDTWRDAAGNTIGPGGAGHSAAPPSLVGAPTATRTPAPTRIQATNGASGMWNDDPFAMTTTRASRGVIPYQGGMIPPGYRLSQRGGVPYLKRVRHMNPLNPRALLRAERRMGAFTSWVKRHFRIASSMPRRKRAAPRRGYARKRRK